MKSKKIISMIAAITIVSGIFAQSASAVPDEVSKLENVELEGGDTNVENKNLLLSYDVNQDFNGVDTLVDISEDIDIVKDLNEGATFIEFNTESTVANQVLFSITDSNDSNSHLYIKLLNGKIRYEVREAGSLKIAYTDNTQTLNDGETHKIIISSGERGSELYIDGVKVYSTANYDQSFNDILTPNAMTIGAIKNSSNANGSEFFNGNIAKVDVYGSELSQEDCIALTECEEEAVTPEKPADYSTLLELINSNEDLNIVFTGDSITHGPMHTLGYRSYSEHLNERITSESIDGYIKEESFVINTGVSSADTDDILSHFDEMVSNHTPDIVFVMIGMNDCVTMTLDQYENNLIEIVERIRDIGALPVLQTCNNTNGSRDIVRNYMQRMREVSVAEEVVLIDHFEYWEENLDVKNTWLNDTIHPNNLGHLEMAKLLMRELGLDTEDSFTYNLEYPLTIEGEFVDTSSIYPYPEYIGLEGVEPLLSYKVDKEFYLNNNIDKSNDIEKIETLEEGSIVARFNMTNGGLAQTLLSLSDGNDASSNVTLAINAGKIHYEVRQDGNIVSATSSTGGYNDGNWHTVVLNADSNGTKIYIDGELILTTDDNGFFADIDTPNNFNIGRNIHNTGTEWHYNGAISYIDVYSEVLTEDQAIAISSENPIVENGAINLEEIKAQIELNDSGAWVFLGDEDTSSNADTAGYKNFIEYFEERVRWELRGSSMDSRRKYMINSGVDGVTSTEILANFDTWAASYSPAVVSVMIGGREEVSLEEFESNLRNIISKIKEIEAIPMLQTPVIKTEDISEYIDVIKKVAVEEEVALIDHYAYWSKIEENQPHVNESWLNENAEPNYRGHLEIAQKMLIDLGIAGGIVSSFDIVYEGEVTQDVSQLKSQLQILIDEATELYDSAEEGDNSGQYPVGSKADLKLSIDFAEVEIDRENSIISIVEARIKELEKAIEIFESLLNDTVIYSDGDFNQDGTVDILDLAIAAKNYGKTDTDSNWSDLEAFDINEDNVIDEYEIEFIMNIIMS